MFNRSRNRTTTHSTAYTGVNQLSVSNGQQPNSNALAAALSIGKSVKPNNDTKPGMLVGRSNSLQVPRSSSMQAKTSGSLLKRNSIIRKSSNNTVGEFKDFSSNSINSNTKKKATPSSKKLVYDIDDSMNDSYFDEVTDETQEYYNNHANMKDLKLSHKPQPQSYRTSSMRTSLMNNRTVPKEGQVKMVKKYIPTPNGIKVVEVPESNIAREVARSNSMRSGRNISRSGSMRSITAKSAPRLSSLVSNGHRQEKKPTSRLSSLMSSPGMTPMLEDVELERSLGQEDDSKEQALKVKNLQKQIEYEKQRARELELRTLEYEELKRLRMENEKKLLTLQRENEDYQRNGEHKVKEEPVLENEERGRETNSEPSVDKNVNFSPVVQDITLFENNQEIHPEIEKPLLTALDQLSNRSSIYDDDEEDDHDDLVKKAVPEVQNNVLNDKIESEFSQDIATEEDVSGIISANSTIDPSSVVVDEFEKKEIEGEASEATILPVDGPVPDSVPKVDDKEQEEVDQQHFTYLVDGSEVKDLEPTESGNFKNYVSESNAELGIINLYNKSASNESLKRDSMIHPLSDTESENNDKHYDEEGINLANQLRPTFDTVPEIIDQDTSEDKELNSNLEVPNAPAMQSSSSSINSAYSTENSSKSKPMKSAMKKSRSFHNSSNNPQAENPAHQAYLSLTTAENTRLNSKLSASQLDVLPPSASAPMAQIPPQSNKPKRMSQSLRNSVPSNPSVLANRSLRPQSAQFTPEQVTNNGMSNKSLRNKTYVQPISTHPTLQPNYESPSKVRAAELYAKANSRASSVFAPIKRRSSYVKEEHVNDGPEQHQTSNTQNMPLHPPNYKTSQPSNAIRTSLRSSPSQNVREFGSQSQSQSQRQHQNTHKFSDSTGSVPSRFEDGNSNPKRFTSRLVDSDDEEGSSNHNSSFMANLQKDTPSLRTPPSKSTDGKQSNPKEKKKFGKLRKLFGRN